MSSAATNHAGQRSEATARTGSAKANTSRTRRRTRIRTREARSRDAGSAAVELTLLTPVLVLVLLFGVAAGRLVSARQQVDSAARQAARAASIARSAEAASQAAASTASSALSGRRVTCRRFDVRADTSAFRPGGNVAVEVTCSVAMGDLALVGLPGVRDIRGRFSATVDRFRGVTPS